MTGGIGGQADTCGSLLGSSMILGEIYGIDKHTVRDMEHMVDAIMKTGAHYNWFVEQFKHPSCRGVVTMFGDGVFYDMGIPEELQKATEAGVVDKCTDLVESVVERVIDQVWDDVQARK